METRKRNLFIGLAAVIAGPLLLAGSIGLQFRIIPQLASLAGQMDLNSGMIFMSYNAGGLDNWTFNFSSASEGFHKQRNLTFSEGQYLQADVTCPEGELLLTVSQGDKREEFDISRLDGPLIIPLNGYEPGKITLRVVINGAKNVKSTFRIEG